MENGSCCLPRPRAPSDGFRSTADYNVPVSARGALMADDRQAVILSAARTPTGKFQGALSGIPATRLGATAVQAAVQRAGVDASQIDEVIMGNVVQAGQGQAPARQAGIWGGVPASVGATTINKVCGSSLKAAMLASQAIRAGDADLFVAGGFESMSRAPFLVAGRSGELKFGNQPLTDALLQDLLWDPFENWAMGNAAEFIADEYEVTREAMDQYALRSHQKAVEAQAAGRFDAEIVPVPIPGQRGKSAVVDQDEGPRKDSSLEALAKLKPVF